MVRFLACSRTHLAVFDMFLLNNQWNESSVYGEWPESKLSLLKVSLAPIFQPRNGLSFPWKETSTLARASVVFSFTLLSIKLKNVSVSKVLATKPEDLQEHTAETCPDLKHVGLCPCRHKINMM